MDSRADVKDIASLERFASSLMQQRGELAIVLEALQTELDRLTAFLETQAPQYWRLQLRRAGERWSEAREALSRCEQVTRVDDRRPCDIERKALAVAKQRIELSEQRLRNIKSLRELWRQQQGQVYSQLRQAAEYNDAGLIEACRSIEQSLSVLRRYTAEEA